MGETVISKVMGIFYYSLLGLGIPLNIQAVRDPFESVIGEIDSTNSFIYSIFLILTGANWAIKQALIHYEKKKEIDDKYKKSSK